MIEKRPPEDLLPAELREDDVEAVRSRFPFKLIGLALLLVVFAAVLYMRWPGSGKEPGRGDAGPAREPVRVPLEEEGSLRNLTEADPAPLRLKRRGEEGYSQDPGKRLARMEAGLDQVEERVEQLNEKLDLLLLVLSRGQEDSTGTPVDSPQPSVRNARVPPSAQPKEKGPAKPASALPESTVKPVVPVPEVSEKTKNSKTSVRKPVSGKESGPTKTATYHVVEPGENLYRIGLKYNLTVSRLMKLNGLKKSDSIRPGQKLLVDAP